jgi:hypothetical protein
LRRKTQRLQALSFFARAPQACQHKTFAQFKALVFHVHPLLAQAMEHDMERPGVTKNDLFHHREAALSSAAFVDRAHGIAERLVSAEKAQGYKSPEARKRVASRIGCAPGTIWNLLRRRLKRVPEGFIAKLHADNVRRLQAELARAEHEYQLALQIGMDPASHEMAALARSTRELLALIEEAQR